MSNDTVNDKRGPDGRFLPGNQPPKSSGRPPGATGLRVRAAHIASERLEAMLGKAADVIDGALNEGDSHVATWLIDRVRPPKNADFVQIDVPSDLTTPQDAVEAAREAVLAAGRGEVSMSEAKAYVALLERLGGMQGYLDLEKLRETLDAMKVAQQGPRLDFDHNDIPPAGRILWGQGAKLD